MKKTILLILLLGAVTFSVSAEKIILTQATYLNTNRAIKIGDGRATHSFSEVGANVTFFTGNDFGFYSSISVAAPIRYTMTGTNTSTNISETDSMPFSDASVYFGFDSGIGIDTLIGVGYNLKVGNSFSILFGGGVHVNGLILGTSDNSFVLGPGISANALFNITGSLNFSIGFMGAWDVVELVSDTTMTNEAYRTTDVTYAVTAGLGFKL